MIYIPTPILSFMERTNLSRTCTASVIYPSPSSPSLFSVTGYSNTFLKPSQVDILDNLIIHQVFVFPYIKWVLNNFPIQIT